MLYENTAHHVHSDIFHIILTINPVVKENHADNQKKNI